MTRRELLVLLGTSSGLGLFSGRILAKSSIEPQPYFAAVNRTLEALEKLGSPLCDSDIEQLVRHANLGSIDEAERILARYTLLRVQVESDGFARTAAGAANAELLEHGWRLFLVRVSNPIRSTAALAMIGNASFIANSPGTGSSGYGADDGTSAAPLISSAWLDANFYESPPLTRELSGFEIEYKLLQLYSRDRGKRDTHFRFVTDVDAVKPGHVSRDAYASMTAIWRYRSRGAALSFVCKPSKDIYLRIKDFDGRGCVASIVIRDAQGRVYPSQGMRLAPDMWFQKQIYRGNGETVRLPNGTYTIEAKRGPEYVSSIQALNVNVDTEEVVIQLQRWIDPSQWGWYSGDTHIHASGCAHYSNPTEGVSPETIIRHARGEGLWISQVLTWAPGWYYQKQFFTGHAESPEASLEHSLLQKSNNTSLRSVDTAKDSESILRYDVEVSGFPSSHSGHPVLLRLRHQDYPGARTIQEWPSWNLPILRWAKAQGGVTGYAHCGVGMEVDSNELPNYVIPFFDGPGANEAIIDVTHGAVDFLSGCNGSPVAELNTWYHLLNCGFRLTMVGETDFPCVTDERPGAGRTYVRLDRPPTGNNGYESWIRDLQRGRLYFGDGRSHILSFTVNGSKSGDNDLSANAGDVLQIEALISAWLPINALSTDKGTSSEKVFLNNWNLLRSRIGNSRNVSVEVLVNGTPVAQQNIEASGIPQPLTFRIVVERSCWVAIRILSSSHTHPVFVIIDAKPIRCSKESARWCMDCIDALWPIVSPHIRENERRSAEKAYDHARRIYQLVASDSPST